MKIELIPSNTDFASLSLKWRNEQSTIKYNPLQKMNLEDVAAYLLKSSSNLSELYVKDNFCWFVQVDAEVIGNVSLKNANNRMKIAEVGYGIGEDFQGKGYGTTSVRHFIKKIFDETDLRKIIAYIHEENLPSRKLIEKIGFKKEGLLREHYIINGEPANEVLYGLLRKEFVSQ